MKELLPFVYSRSKSDQELIQILELQQNNTRYKLSPGEIQSEGFVTVVHDLEILTHNVALGSTADRIDLNGDVNVDFADLHFWVTDLKDTWIGDANLDGEFNSGDFVQVFSAGKYETDEFATWSEGDWNADERFDSGDFVAAFANGGYEQGPRVAAAVPEPSGRLLAFLVLGALPFVRARLS